MSRRRSRQPDEDGIELMLDTIANLFGGILLIAMLIAIMAGQQTHAISERGGREDVYSVIRAEDAISVARQRIRSADLEHARSLARAASASTDTETRLILEQLLQSEIESRESNRKQLEQRKQVLDTLRKQANAREGITTTLEQELNQLKLTLNDRAKQLQEAKEMRSPPLVLPRGGTTRTRVLPVVFRYGRLSVPFGVRGERIESNAHYVDVSGGGIEYRPTPQAGISPEMGLDSTQQWQRLLREHPSSAWHFEITVYPDSYEAFMKARPTIVAAGYEYRILPHTIEQPLIYGYTDQEEFIVGQ